MPLADTYPLLEVFETLLIFFAFVIWLWLVDSAEYERIKTKALAG